MRAAHSMKRHHSTQQWVSCVTGACRVITHMLAFVVASLLLVVTAATYGKEAPTLTLDQRDFLPPAPKGADDEGDETTAW